MAYYERKRRDGFTETFNKRGNYTGGFGSKDSSGGKTLYDSAGNRKGYKDVSGNRFDASGNPVYRKK